jgi:hypothetical protein
MEWLTNASPLLVKLEHISGRHQALGLAPYSTVMDRTLTVIAFTLPPAGHVDSEFGATLDGAHSPWKMRTQFVGPEERLVYLLADIRRHGGLVRDGFHVALQAGGELGLWALASRVAQRPAAQTAFERRADAMRREETIRPLVNWLNEQYDRHRPKAPNGYLNAMTRKPAWKGTIRGDQTASPTGL